MSKLLNYFSCASLTPFENAVNSFSFYLKCSNISIKIFDLQELFINLIGGILFIITGAFTIKDAQRYNHQEAEMALGCLCVITGIIFLIDFIVSVRNSRVTVVRTTRTVNL